ncbi:S9 family peptidase [Sphingomonas sp. PL-96]|uniref:alpha/beta hydrolase family protein n=1 Tax=Sphingomonas sp. PL-96 TaxID=2887201 RepID=UPI001E3E5C50|nr:S9 family peptidase [Sphingomonas sp. PL-96]MCC2977482.1 S9 family peptidase [Sphingomonas sp. PL-96]
MKFVHWVSGASLLCAGMSAWAQAPGPATDADATRLAAAFGAREQVQQISISPDGRKVALLAPAGARGVGLLVGDRDKGGEPKQILTSSGEPERLTHCFWSTNERIVCGIYSVVPGPDLLGFTRLISLNSDGGDMKVLSARTSTRALGTLYDGGRLIDRLADDKGGTVLMTRSHVPESTTGTMLASSAKGVGVEQVNTTTLARRQVEQPRGNVVDYVSDGHGTVRIMGIQSARASGYNGDQVNYSYRLPESRGWQPLGTFNVSSRAGFNPYAVDPDLNVAYGFDLYDGRSALYRLALDGSGKRELVLARPDVDVDGLIQIGRQSRVVGASFATDRRQAVFFDPEIKALQGALQRALPGQPLVTFLDASADEKQLLLLASGDVDPGMYYVYDKQSRALEQILPARPQLAAATLAPVKAITYPAADGTQIPAYLTMPAGGAAKTVGAIVLPHGGPGARDEWGFDWLSQFLAARGFAVLQPNFRGSAGYGDAWFQKNGFQSWRTAVGDVNDGGRWLVQQGVAKPDKLAVLGWSYGGYAALQSAVLDPALFKAIVAIAPVTDLDRLREESRQFTNFLLVDQFIGHGAHVREGSPAQNAARIQAPVLLFHGDLDRNVGVAESRLMADRLRDAGGKVDFVEFKGLDHYLDDSDARTRMLAQTDAFLRTSLKIAP